MRKQGVQRGQVGQIGWAWEGQHPVCRARAGFQGEGRAYEAGEKARIQGTENKCGLCGPMWWCPASSQLTCVSIRVCAPAAISPARVHCGPLLLCCDPKG